ncbi:MAG: bifunctional diaminohydroxyphosphoribosylaminopyrimidine deaminase/5-amino-6-(5-phosphoribosylamino)uracil reductase RibD [Candidatus Aadella gelida]|nr:bifunctional diaminohydroxyphosphoribosylaminopyrimidine deaminase/5-amino-6-(5-phosphoribosylamino)uracil reductase RibD [Candidatus Aadella gelida]
MTKNDKIYMREALSLAEKAKERTYPNPMVGAVIVRSGRIIGRGYHKQFGGMHAEPAAIGSSDIDCIGSDMYVTLEPCDHYGKTPPCTDKIIKSGIKRVFVAMKDPNPLNAGKGIKKLRRAGIEVFIGLHLKEAEWINRKYLKYITTGMPYITVKLAQSLDGKIAARDGSSKWISSGASRRHVKKIRSTFDAVMVGSNTIKTDNPLLLGSGKRVPARITVDTCLKISEETQLIKTARNGPVIIGTTELASKQKIRRLGSIPGVEIDVRKSQRGKVPLKSFLKGVAKKGLINILVEGGGEVVGNMLDNGLVDEVMVFISPKIIGGSFGSIKGGGVKNIGEAYDLDHVKITNIGPDILVSGTLNNRG